jgi:polyisoprenoid-binding protein YceI
MGHPLNYRNSTDRKLGIALESNPITRRNTMKNAALGLIAVALASLSLGTMAAAAPLKVQGTIEWTGYGIGKSHTGDIQIQSGEVEMKGKDIVGGQFVFDMKTLATKDSAKLQGHLRSPDFFDVEKFEKATFKITKSETLAKPGPNGETHKVTGDLTIRDKTAPITFEAKVADSGKIVVASAKAQIADRTKYDIKYNSKQFYDPKKLADKLIEDKIDIRLNLQASR